jgi:hypothetical protein
MRTAADGRERTTVTLDGYGRCSTASRRSIQWEGRFREQFAPKSMARSFRETPPKIQFDHGRHPNDRIVPIASLRSITEDVHPELAPEGGAHIVARIFDNWLMQPVSGCHLRRNHQRHVAPVRCGARIVGVLRR